MTTIRSADGTGIATECVGEGPPLVLVVGAFCDRATGRELAGLLADSFTVHTYDRRGRGDSDRPPAPPFDPAREIEDLAALLAHIGAPAHVYGHSSGAVLAALTAASRPVRSLALYEPPWSDGPRRGATMSGRAVQDLVAAGRPGEAAAAFLRGTGMPDAVVDMVRAGPGWTHMEALAPTLPYDLALLGDGAMPAGVLRTLDLPTLVMAGGGSAEWARASVAAAAQVIPGARHVTVPGQDHQVAAAAVEPWLRGFLAEL